MIISLWGAFSQGGLCPVPIDHIHCVVCSFLIYSFWLPHWDLQTFFVDIIYFICIPFNDSRNILLFKEPKVLFYTNVFSWNETV